MPSGQDPWILEGDLLSAQDVEAAKDIPFYNSMRYIYALRLALLYDAPLDVQTRISAEGRSDSSATSGTVLAVEWSFLTAFVDIRRGGLRAEVAAQYADLERCAICECEETDSALMTSTGLPVPYPHPGYDDPAQRQGHGGSWASR